MSDLLLDTAVSASRKAGEAILGFYKKGDAVSTKSDGSPLSLADTAAHNVIYQSLLPTNIPIVSEEGNDLHMDASIYWLVDPLDGTKDFIAGNDEFTVNIALIKDCKPILGVVFAPALGEMFAGQVGQQAWTEKGGIRMSGRRKGISENCSMGVSRFHDHPDVDLFGSENGIKTRIAMGSALKYGRLATAEIDVFPRLVGSSEWDTAAGQAVLESAGGLVLDWDTGLPLRYGKPRRRNPRLLSLRAPYAFESFKLKAYPDQLE